MQKEFRFATFTPAEDGKLIGYPIVFNSESRNLGGFTEIVTRDAVQRTLSDGHDVKAFYNHDAAQLLGRTQNDSLKLTVDDHGVRMELTVPDTTLGRDVKELVRTKTLSAMSFGFYVNKDEVVRRSGDDPLRKLLDIELVEVSVVAEPAYEATTVSVRSVENVKEEDRKAAKERILAALDVEHKLFELTYGQRAGEDSKLD